MSTPKLTLKVPGGIGDIAWIYAKLCRRGYTIQIVPSDDKPHRSLPFLKLLPQVDKPYYGTFMAGEVAANGQHTSIPDEGEYFLSANQHLEDNRRLENFLPDDTLDYHFWLDIPLKDYIRADNYLSGIHRPLVLYPSSMHNFYLGKWEPSAWAEIAAQLCKLWNMKLILLGAEYDREMIDGVEHRLNKLNQPVEAKVVGQNLSLALAIIQRSAYFFGFQSGLGILASMLNTASTMMLGRNLSGLVNSWAPAHQMTSGRFKGTMFPAETFPTGKIREPGDQAPAKLNEWQPVFNGLKELNANSLFIEPEFEVVTGICDKSKITKETIDKLLHYSDGKYRITVVDNACSDGIETYLLSLSNEGRIRLLRTEQRVCASIARNMALMTTKTEFVLSIDDDVWVERKWYEEFIRVLKDNPKTAMVGPCGSLINSQENIRHAWDPRGYEDALFFGSPSRTAPTGMKLDSIPTMCVGFRRQAVMDVGLFDPIYKPLIAEDADLCMKLKQAGWDLRVARAAVRHFGKGQNSHEMASESMGEATPVWVQRNMDIFYERWGHSLRFLESSR